MRWLALGTLLALSALATGCNEAEAAGFRCRISRNGSRSGSCADWLPVANSAAVAGPDYTEFAFAPDSGIGMGTECAGTVPTQVDGGTVTFTRASAATCLKGDGTIVALTSGQPAVMPAPYTGNGALGILWEAAVTNDVLRSEKFDDVAWVSTAAVTANSDVAPDGTTTADTLTDSSAGVVQGSVQVVATTDLVAYVTSVFVKPGSVNSISLSQIGTGASQGNRTCTMTITSDNRCKQLGTGSAWYRCACVGNSDFGAGLTAITVTVGVGSAASDQGTLVVWGAQLEEQIASSFDVTSYIATTSAAATRAATSWTFTAPGTVTAALGCIGGTGYGVRFDGSRDWGFGACGLFGWDGAVSRLPYLTNGATGVRTFDGANQNTSASLSDAAHYGAIIRVSSRWTTASGGSINAWSTATGLGTPAAAFNDGNFGSAMVIGRAGASCGFLLQGWMTDIRMDNTAGACD